MADVSLVVGHEYVASVRLDGRQAGDGLKKAAAQASPEVFGLYRLWRMGETRRAGLDYLSLTVKGRDLRCRSCVVLFYSQATCAKNRLCFFARSLL